MVNGDDSLSTKANSTNVLIQDSVFINGNGFALGSIGQYKGVYERIENVTVERIKCFNTLYPGYIKTWTGIQQSYPPNGGGGGLGYAKNVGTYFKAIHWDMSRELLTKCYVQFFAISKFMAYKVPLL